MNIKEESVYQIYVKSFADSNGDGIGDLQGIISKLDHIAGLGVSCVWLTPIYPSPMRDNGYDVSDYCAINPLFGTMEDFDLLVTEATKRGLKIMLDMVLNHSSTEHAWFKRALAGERKYQDYYIFKQTPSPEQLPTNWISKFGGSAWSFSPEVGKHYLHLFDRTQADLNWENPELREELFNIVNFWLAKGVKGLRFDVINLISKPNNFIDDHKGDGRRFYTDGPRIHTHLKELHARTFGLVPGCITVGEMSSTSIENCIRYSVAQEKELSMVFTFHHLKVDYANGNKWTLAPLDFIGMKKLFNEWQTKMQAGGGVNALFWSNHDQPRVVSRFGNDTQFHYQSSTMLAVAQYLMDGVPYIYQGEEIGMTNAYFTSIDQYKDVESLNYFKELTQNMSASQALTILATKSRDNGRTPISWNDTQGHGFTTGTPWLPFSTRAGQVNVKKDRTKCESIYTFFQLILQLRQNYSVFIGGIYQQLAHDHPSIYAYQRQNDTAMAMVFCNFSTQTSTMMLPKALPQQLILNNYEFCHKEGLYLTMQPYQLLVFHN
jgi:trehalose-6-phosphate hydrolase